MFLTNLKLHNFRCFENLEINFHPHLTVIVGSNGAGKTSILEGAAIALSSMFVKMDGLNSRKIEKTQAHLKLFSIGSTKDVQAQYPVEITASAQIYDDNQKNEKEITWTRCLNSSTGQTSFGNAKEITSVGMDYPSRIRSGDTELCLPIIAYYGTGRLWDYHREKQTNVFETTNRLNGYTDCVDGTTNVKLMMNWFLKSTVKKYQNQELGLDGIPELDAVYSAMETCFQRITGCANAKIQYDMGSKELEVAYKNNNGNMMRIPINQLSDGYKSTISLVADIAYRMAVLNPQFLGNVCKETNGIILIDEVDLHLHPEWQQRILGDLTAIFPKIQFIVTTHAAAVISSAKSENLRIMKDQQVEMVNTQVFGNDTNSIYRLIMDVPERDPGIAKLFDKFNELLKSNDFDGAEKILDEIDEIRGGHDKEVSRNRVKLKLERIRGGSL